MINADGTDLSIVVRSEEGGPFSDVQWSADKRRIGFTGHVQGNERIFLVDSDGSRRKILSLPKESLRIPDQKYDLSFVGWSPSGKYVLYRYRDYYNHHYGVMTANGKVLMPLGGVRPSFGGSDEVAYTVFYGSQMATGADILVLELETQQKQNLTSAPGQRGVAYYEPFVSPEGELVAFTYQGAPLDESEDRPVYELWVMHSDGSRKTKLASRGKDFEGRWLTSVKFSPGAQKMMFIHDEEEKSRIYVISTDGTGLQAITDKIVKATGGASWSPDGKQIVFTSDQEGNDELYIVNADGSGLRRLTNNTTMDCCPDW